MTTDATAVQKDYQRKREEDLVELKKQVEEEAREHETQMGQLRTKHNALAEELNNQLDTFKRGKASLGKYLLDNR